METQKLNTV